MCPSSQDMAAAGELSGHSIPQLRQILVTVFGLLVGAGLAASAPSSSSGSAATHAAGSTAGGGNTSTSTAAADSGSSIIVQGVLKELKECPLLPLYGSQGALVPTRADGSAAVFFPVEGLGATVQVLAAGKPSHGNR